jgi:RNA polymerase sigma-70 factor (ECF subfamily)
MRNDRKAQQALYVHYSSRMYGVCLRYYPNVEIAQDILQDGFIKVFENIHSFRFEGSIEGWIRRIIINTALEYHRKIKDEKMVDLSDALLLSQEP